MVLVLVQTWVLVNALVSLAVVRSDAYDRVQIAAQCAIIRLLPAVGAVIVWTVLHHGDSRR